VEAATYRKWDGGAPRAYTLYAFAQFLLVLGATSYLLFRQESLSRPVLVAGTLLVVWSLVVVGGLLEGRRWAFPIEVARLATLAVFALLNGRAGSM
jgi:hypothetical protein